MGYFCVLDSNEHRSSINRTAVLLSEKVKNNTLLEPVFQLKDIVGIGSDGSNRKEHHVDKCSMNS